MGGKSAKCRGIKSRLREKNDIGGNQEKKKKLDWTLLEKNNGTISLKIRGDNVAEDFSRGMKREESTSEKVNNLLLNLLQKEEEINVYKERLKELQTAFYYNLDIIAERDLELSVLEKRLNNENVELQQVIQEKVELEDIVKSVEEKYYRKIQQLESKILLKNEEIKELQRDNVGSVSSLKKVLNDTKLQQQKQIQNLTNKFESEKNQLKKRCSEEIEEREKYYIQEIDNLSGRLEEVLRENKQLSEIEEENKSLKCQILETERSFLEKENYYLYELSKFSSNSKKKIHKELQCNIKIGMVEKVIQTVKNTNSIFTQTTLQPTQGNPDAEESYNKKIKFLQEQNEVLKCVVKDLKKSLNEKAKVEVPTCSAEEKTCENYSAIRSEVKQINEKFDFEIRNLKKILEKEQKQRAEEESIIQSLESSVTCLKDRLLLGLQENLHQISEEGDICSYTYNRELQNEIKVCHLEEKLSKTIDSLTNIAEVERKQLDEKLEEFKTECLGQVEKLLREKQPPIEVKSEGLLEKIRQEIQKLENKIEGDMKNIVRNNIEFNKCEKNLKTRVRFSDKKEIIPSVSPSTRYQEAKKPKHPPRVYYSNDVSMERCISVVKVGKFQNECQKKRFGVQKSFALPNDLIVAS